MTRNLVFLKIEDAHLPFDSPELTTQLLYVGDPYSTRKVSYFAIFVPSRYGFLQDTKKDMLRTDIRIYPRATDGRSGAVSLPSLSIQMSQGGGTTLVGYVYRMERRALKFIYFSQYVRYTMSKVFASQIARLVVRDVDGAGWDQTHSQQ